MMNAFTFENAFSYVTFWLLKKPFKYSKKYNDFLANVCSKKKDMTEGESQCKMYHPIYSHRRSRELSTASLIGTIKECIWLIFTMLSFSLERFFWCYNLFTTSKAIVVVNFRFCQKFLSDLELRTKCDSYLA